MCPDFSKYVLLISACVYVFYVAAISLLNATSPLMYELTAEMSYPITEEFLGGKEKILNLGFLNLFINADQ